jgi:hypothetical protein
VPSAALPLPGVDDAGDNGHDDDADPERPFGVGPTNARYAPDWGGRRTATVTPGGDCSRKKSCKRVSSAQNGHREVRYLWHEPIKDHDFVFIN